MRENENKFQLKLEKIKKTFKIQVTELRTEIARREIKHQEELLAFTRNQEPKQSKEIKFIIDGHKNEIELLKKHLEETKLELTKKSTEVDLIRDDKLKQIGTINCNANNQINELKNQNKYLKDQISAFQETYDRDIRILKNININDFNAGQNSNNELVEKLRKERDFVIHQKNIQICALQDELDALKVNFICSYINRKSAYMHLMK